MWGDIHQVFYLMDISLSHYSQSLGRVSGVSLVHDDVETAVDHPLAIKRHRIFVRMKALVGFQFFPAGIARLFRGPDDPGKHDGLVFPAFHRLGK